MPVTRFIGVGSCFVNNEFTAYPAKNAKANPNTRSAFFILDWNVFGKNFVVVYVVIGAGLLWNINNPFLNPCFGAHGDEGRVIG